MVYNLLDDGFDVENNTLEKDVGLSNDVENEVSSVYEKSYTNDKVGANEEGLYDAYELNLPNDFTSSGEVDLGENLNDNIGGFLEEDDDDRDDDEELDEKDPDYDWEHIFFLKELKKALDATDVRLAKEREERRKNGGLLNSQLVNFDDYEYEDFSEYDHLSDEEIQKMCGDMSDLDGDAINEFWKTHKIGAPHILINPETGEEIGAIYDTPTEEEEEE